MLGFGDLSLSQTQKRNTGSARHAPSTALAIPTPPDKRSMHNIALTMVLLGCLAVNCEVWLAAAVGSHSNHPRFPGVCTKKHAGHAFFFPPLRKSRLLTERGERRVDDKATGGGDPSRSYTGRGPSLRKSRLQERGVAGPIKSKITPECREPRRCRRIISKKKKKNQAGRAVALPVVLEASERSTGAQSF